MFKNKFRGGKSPFKRGGRVRKKASMRRRIFTSFFFFSIIVLIMIWLFQTVFLEFLYKNVRIGELKRCAARLEDAEPSSFDTDSDILSGKYNICISIYKIDGYRDSMVVQKHVNLNPYCFIHNTFSDSLLGTLYYKARERDYYMETVSLGASSAEKANLTAEDSEGESIIYAKLVKVGSDEYLMLLNTHIYPLSSTVATLRIMFVYVSIALFVMATALSVVLSRRISKPTSMMSAEARKLAMGNYDVCFDGGEYKETTELGDALNRAAKELSQLDRMQKDLIANISHDLRTPLTLIAGYSEIMRDLPGEMTAENMQIIIDETRRLTSLVNDLLDKSKLSDGGASLSISEFNLTETIDEVIVRYSKLKETEGYKISFEYDEMVYVCADKTRILQVLYNLINNAISYTGEDRVVKLKQILNGKTCRIEVSDTGSGISEEELPLIWERYYKAKEFHKRSSMGTGLGLSIVKNILVLHEAKFGVNSRPGAGSTFWFELPVSLVKKKDINGENDL